MKHGRAFLVAATVIAFEAAAIGGPLVVAIPPARELDAEDARQPVTAAVNCLSVMLHERLAERPGLHLIDADRFSAIADTTTSPALAAPGKLTLADFAGRLSLDVLLRIEAAEAAVTVTVERRTDARPTPATATLPYATAADFGRLLTETAGLVGPALGLDATETAALAWPDLVPDGSASAADLLQAITALRTRVNWGDVGLGRLSAMTGAYEKARSSPILARSFLTAGRDLGRGNMQQPVDPAMRRLRLVIPLALGTPAEPAAVDFVRNTAYERAGIESDLLTLLKDFRKGATDSVEAALEEALETDDAPAEPGLIRDTSMAAAARDGSNILRQCGGLRALAALQSRQAPPLLTLASTANDARLRRAAADGFGEFPAPVGEKELATLAIDADPAVALAAIRVLVARDAVPTNAASRVRQATAARPHDSHALRLLCALATADDLPALRTACSAADPALRNAGWQARLRLAVVGDEDAAAWLTDADGSVASAGIAALPIDVSRPRTEAAVRSLANDADWTVAEAARLRLAPGLPQEPRARRLAELEIEHPYVRSQIVRQLAVDGSTAATEDLLTACGNTDHVVRADALAALARVAPEQARTKLAAGLADPWRLVRLEAAAAAAAIATPADAAMLDRGLAAETDAATRRHLALALARATGKPAPAVPPVHRLGIDRNVVFLCGHGPDAAGSPFGGYYDLSAQVDEPLAQAHDSGKVVLARVRTAPNPAQVELSRQWRDIYWQPLDDELMPGLDQLDGVVLGEETMYFRPFQAWPQGWRLFCREAGIDPARIAGRQEALSAREKEAWWAWEQRVAIEGFNRIHDFVKQRYGALRPGFQTATFMPDQNGPCLHDRDWKFDIAAAYYYDAGNRERYARIRRLKTVWPDRPVLWLSYGSVNAPKNGFVNHALSMPATPRQEIASRAYADSVAAWLAGGHTGYFQSMLFVNPRMKPGPMAAGSWITPEDLFPGSHVLSKALDGVFRGLDQTYRLRTAAAGAAPRLDLETDVDADAITLEEAPPEDAATVRVKAERLALERGFLLERHQLDEITRLLTGLPFPANEKPSLVVGDIAAAKGVARLPHEFDALDGLEKLAAQPLAAYRFVAVDVAGSGSYRDATIRSVKTWLEREPGVFCVQGWLATTGTRPLAGPESLDESFAERWPWEDDIRRSDDGQITFAADRCRLLAGTIQKPEALAWRGAGCRGVVLFDFDGKATEPLTKELVRLAAASGDERCGIAFPQPAGMVHGTAGGLTAWAAGRIVAGEFSVPGMDLLTGAVNPVLRSAPAAAIVAERYSGPYVAVADGVSALGEQPLEEVDASSAGLRLKSAGLVRAISRGPLDVSWNEPPPPDIATDKPEFLAWLLEGDTPGIATLREPGRPTVTYIRSSLPFTLRHR